MKKIFSMILAFVCVIFSAQVQAADFKIDYGNSKIFTKSEIDSCIDVIEKELNEWGCTLLTVSYVGDEFSNTKENIKELNKLAKSRDFKKKFTKCLILKTDFMSPTDPKDGKITAWRYDSKYTNYEWHFGFYKVDGKFKLLNNGY